jgi:hypothetical protein
MCVDDTAFAGGELEGGADLSCLVTVAAATASAVAPSTPESAWGGVPGQPELH